MRKVSHYLPLLFRDAVQNLVHLHAIEVPVMSETNDDHAVFLRQNGLVYLPAIVQIQEHVRHLEQACAAGSQELPHESPRGPTACDSSQHQRLLCPGTSALFTKARGPGVMLTIVMTLIFL